MDTAITGNENTKAIAFLSLSMALFAVDDMFIKLASSEVGAGQILTIQSLLGALYFAWLARIRSQPITREALFSRPILLRHASEATGAVCFVVAISLMPISNASAILQASPLIVTFGAALLLRETVGLAALDRDIHRLYRRVADRAARNGRLQRGVAYRRCGRDRARPARPS